MATDLDKVFFNTDDFAEIVIYNGSSINAIVAYGSAPMENYEYGAKGSTMAEATIIVKKDDVANPQYRDTVVVGSVTYVVQRIITGNGYTWTISMRTNERPRLR